MCIANEKIKHKNEQPIVNANKEQNNKTNGKSEKKIKNQREQIER